jgi:FAD/FMN-containing dehydrogenase
MRGADVDPERRTARVRGGSLLAELDDAAQAHGLVCPVGVVSHTGVAGLTLGGGMGRLQRKLGLTIDSLLAVEVVTADGRVVRASEDENPELFWGMRGAGANFGIVTSFEFRLHPFEGLVTHGTVTHPIERAEELAERFRELVDEGPDELWTSFGMAVGGDARGPVASVSVLHSGSPADAERDLAALRALGDPLEDSIESKPYLASQRLFDAPMEWGQRFSMKSSFLGSLPEALVRDWADQVSRAPAGAEGGISIWCWGRAIAAVPEEATAFTGRDATCWAAAEIIWNDGALDDDCRSWARAVADLAAPHASVGRYVNDVTEVGRDVARMIYGDAKYERLVALKREWDPDNVFRLNQNITP